MRLQKTFLFLSIILTLSFLAKDANSQNDTVKDIYDMSLEELMNIEVITASKISQKATDAPATVYVINRSQIESRNYSCLKDVLNEIPQIEIQEKSISQNSDIFTLNGVAGNEKFIILLDGIRINSTTGTEHTIGQSYFLDNVKQIEIILGPASSLYGADAFTGIINIITFKGYENKGLDCSLNYGMFNTTNSSVVFNTGTKKLSLSVAGKYYHSDEPFFPDYFPDEYQWYNHYSQTGEMLLFGDTVKPHSDIKPWATPTNSYGAIAKINFKKIELGYSHFFESHSNSVASLPSTYIYSKETVYANHIQNAYLKHDYTSKNNNLMLQSILSTQDFKVYPHSLFYNQYAGYLDAYKYERNKTIKFEEQISYNISKNLHLLGGLSYQYHNAIPKTSDLPFKYDESIPHNEQQIYYPGTNVTDSAGNDLTIFQDIYNIKYSNLGSYIQFQYNPIKSLIFTVGSRFDKNSKYGNTFNPRAGIVFNNHKKITVKLLYGQAYLAPSPYKSHQHYGSFYPITNQNGEITGLASGFWQLPNEDLKPEKRVSYDVYILYKILPQLALTANAYFGQISELIGKTGTDTMSFHGIPIDWVTQTVNSGDAVAYGGTFRLDYNEFFKNSSKLNLFAAYSFSDGNINKNPLIFSSKHSVKSGIEINFKRKLSFYTFIMYRSGAHSRKSTADINIISDPFTIVNLSLNYIVYQKMDKKINIFAQINNMLNKKYYNAGYENFDFTPQDPFNANFGLRINL